MMADEAFEAAADAIVDGDEAALKVLLAQYPKLVQARSSRHGATLLHYIAANGVENERQKTSPNAVAVAQILLDAGADPNATAEFYGGPIGTLDLLVSSVHPHEAGLQASLANLLLDAGADGHETLLTALGFGYDDTARDLARRLPVETLPVAAGLGCVETFDAVFAATSLGTRHQAVVLAAMYGHIAILERLVAAGEDLDRFNPPRLHGHATPLHLAVSKGHLEAVRWLVEHGARIDIADTIHGGTALGWARHEHRAGIVRYLESL